MEQILGLCAGRLISSTANSFILAFMYLTLCTVAQSARKEKDLPQNGSRKAGSREFSKM